MAIVVLLISSAPVVAAADGPPSPEVLVNHIADLVAKKVGARNFDDLQKRATPEARAQQRASVESTLAATRRLAASAPGAYRDYASCVMAAQTFEAQKRCEAAMMGRVTQQKAAARSTVNEYAACTKAATTEAAQRQCDDRLRQSRLEMLRGISPEASRSYESCLSAAKTAEERDRCDQAALEWGLQQMRTLSPAQAQAYEACLRGARTREAQTACSMDMLDASR